MADIYIGEVEPESVAGRTGRIQEGDQIIKVDTLASTDAILSKVAQMYNSGLSVVACLYFHKA